MQYRLIVFLSSAVLAAAFATIGGYLYWQTKKYSEIELVDSTDKLYSIYTIQNEILSRHAQALAYSIATNTEIQHLLDEGNAAVHAEGGHGGGKRAARVRDALREYVNQQWGDLPMQHEVQHMHFILPDGVSFLRMDVPSHFGDSLLSARPMLADTARDHLPRCGFEIGHTYTGLIGIAPVMRVSPSNGKRFVGMIEAGFDTGRQIRRLDKQLNIGIALLLNNHRILNATPESHQPTTLAHRHFILAASRPEVNNWLRDGLLPESRRTPQTQLLAWQGRQFQLISFALDDHQSQLDPQFEPPGTVLLWHDITPHTQRLEAKHTAIFRGIFTVYAITQFALLVLIRLFRREWERRLKKNTTTIENLSQRNALLLDTAADGICGIDHNGCITFINRAALTMHGYQLEEVMGKNLYSLFHRNDPGGQATLIENCQLMQALSDRKSRESEEWLSRRDGSCFPAKMTITPIRGQGPENGAVVVFHDITEQRNRQEALLQLATTDSLTGASNRRHFLDQLEAELSRQRRHGGSTSLLMTDLDLFKRVNDGHGHAAGDAVLSHFVHIVRQTVRRSDIIGRLGGEEFAILLPGVGISGARELAERLRNVFEHTPAKIGNVFIPATVSIGISDLRVEDRTADSPLHRADEALYSAKEAGRNCTMVYNPDWQRSNLPGTNTAS
ncbi:MAG: diguanylate cyclase [Azoarcus sp.]|jgi:diguanylate cyclase (GGDEF)-like protein/PAS domain S-box-containing protein|nr:diguanylate cyclase [Azoarcus sp.]